MKYVFFGTPEFAATILKNLIDAELIPVAVVCNPDRPAGRKKIITPPRVKDFILKNGDKSIEILQPEKLKDIEPELKRISPDFILVAAYGKIIPASIIKIPKLGVVGVHPSLLPLYRGATPIQSVILDDKEETGVSLYILDQGVDSGPILNQSKIDINNSNYLELEERLAQVASELLVKTLPNFILGKIQPISQDDKQATYTQKFNSDAGFISYGVLEEAKTSGKDSFAVLRKIKALNPEPGVYTLDKNGTRINLLVAKIEKNKLRITKLQVAGKKPQIL